MWREEEEGEEEKGILLLSFFAPKLHLLRGESGGVRKEGGKKLCLNLLSLSLPFLFYICVPFSPVLGRRKNAGGVERKNFLFFSLSRYGGK